MQKFVAVLFSGVSIAGIAAYSQSAAADAPAWAAEATTNPDYLPAAPAPATETAAQPADAAPAAAEPTETLPAATASEAEALPPQTGPGVTEYYGIAPAGSSPAFAAEATVNPDYSADAPAAATETAADPASEPAAATEAASQSTTEPATDVASEPEPLPPQTGPGATEFYGESKPASSPAWAAEATINPDAAATATAPASSGDVSAERQQQIEACRDALNGEVQAAKLMFGSGKWDILPVSYNALDKIAKVAVDCGDVVIEVDGYTDNQGKPESNVTISQLRAESVVKYLIRAGVDAAKLKAVGKGDASPVASNETPEGRRQNRRIEFVVWDKASQS